MLELLRHHQVDVPEDPSGHLALPQRIGPYQILGLLGRGGMGIVYRAQREGGEPVALKVLEPGVLAGRSLGRFRRESAVLEQLDHPGIARFLEAGTYDSSLGPRPFYVMELVDGRILSDLARDATWGDRERIALLADLAEALDHAHERGVVHRDLKPENVVVTASGKPKVLDFGVARITAGDLRSGTLSTATGVLLGTVRYMSPEQAQGLSDEVDRRSDVYALGVLGYELLSGGPPYELHTRSVTRALVQVATAVPRPLGEVRPALRGPIERVIARALEKRPEDRYPTAAEFAADLRRYLAGERVRTPGPSLAVRITFLARSRPWAAGTLLVAVAALVALAMRGHWPGGEPSPAAADAATARACALLDSVDTRLHHGPRTPQSLTRVARLLRETEAEIRRLGTREYAADLRRYAAWRNGEMHFFRAGIDDDPDGFLRAAEVWSHARTPARPFPFALHLPDSTVPIYPRITRMWPQQADAGIALAFSEVARDRQPAHYSRLALEHAEAAWAILAHERQVDSDPLRWVPPPGHAGVEARLLNDLGAAAAAVGYYEDSLATLERGLAVLRQAQRAGYLDDDLAAAASLQHHFGQAWLWRARLVRAPADVDSAVARLRLALSQRALMPSNTSISETREALAEALRLGARLRSERLPARAWVDRAAQVVDEGLREPAAATGSRRERLMIARAAAWVDQAVLGRNTLALAVAESLFAAGQDRFRRDRYPVVHARLQRELGRAEAARWMLTGEPQARLAALSSFGAATDALTESQHRSFRLEAAAATRWLAVYPVTAMTLASPALWP